MIDQVTEPANVTPPPPERKWTFVRAADGRIGGVCQSLAVATGLDLTLVRLAMIGAALWGPGLIAYVALLIAVPRADRPDDPRVAPAPEETAKWIRIALAVGGALGVASVVGGIGWADWPVGSFYRDGGGIGITLIAVAIAVVVLRRRQRDGGTPPASSHPVPPAHPARPATGGGAVGLFVGADTVERVDDVRPPVEDAIDAPAPVEDATTPFALAVPEPASPMIAARSMPNVPNVPNAAATETDADANRTALLLTRIAGWLIVLAALGVATGLIVALRLGVLELRLPVLVWTLATAALGAACVALVKARSIAIISVSLVALVLVWGIGAVATSWAGPTGTRTIVVADAGELAATYEHAAGWLTLDLSALPHDDDATVAVDVRAGRTDVVVPDDAAVDVSSDLWAGDSELLGQSTRGWKVNDRVRDIPPGATSTLTIDLDMGVGTARVCRAAQADDDRHCPS